MTGGFSALSTALSALTYNRVVIDTATDNIANVGTEGYVRRRVVGHAVGSPSVPALWSTYQGAGGGVAVAGRQRMTEQLLDQRSRAEHASSSFLDARAAALSRLETGLGEPGDNGLASVLGQLRAAWHDLANDPAGGAARTQVLAVASSVTDAVHAQASAVGAEVTLQGKRLVAQVAEVDSVSAQLADVNRTLRAAVGTPADVTAIEDRRDQLSLRLSELTGATTSVGDDRTATVMLAGATLVSGASAASLSVTGGLSAGGDATGGPVTFAVSGPAGTQAVAGLTGGVGAAADLVSTTLPGYRAALDTVVRTVADEVNGRLAAGYDQDGAPGAALFSYDAADPSGTLAVALIDGRRLAASGVPGGGLDASVATGLASADSGERAYQSVVSNLGIEVARAQRQSETQSLLTTQVDSVREQQAGVNLDEETISTLTAQRGYEAAARVMTVVDSVLDTLINRTGILR